MGWRLTTAAVLALGLVASCAAMLAQAIRDFDDGLY